MAGHPASAAQMVKILKIGLIVLFLGTLATHIWSQQRFYVKGQAPGDSIRIDRVVVVGNLRTKKPIILRELEFRPGEAVTWKNLELAQKRIENLYLFNRVQFRVLKFDTENVLKINVTERWTLFPIPILNFNEHSFSKISYGGGVADYNFRGRAEKIILIGWAGFNPGFEFSYQNGWFGGPKRYFASLSAHSVQVANHTTAFKDLESRINGLSIGFGRRFGIYKFINFGTNIEQVKPSNPMAALRSTGRDFLWGGGVSLKYDNRDLHEYPTFGHLAELGVHKAWLNSWGKGYTSYLYDFRFYHSFRSAIFAVRTFGEFLDGDIPVYKRLFLGYGERIRGHFSETFEGEKRLLNSMEMRFPIIPKRYYSLSQKIPALKDLEFAVYGTLFGDTGIVWTQPRRLALKHFQSGFGMGINMLLPYSNIVRFEFAWNENLEGEFIFDSNVAF